MQKVVTNGLKIDLHIHSACSSLKDGAKVKGNTIANIPLLVQKLDEQQVNSMLNGISPNLGTLVDLHYLKGFSINELSGISGISRSTIAKRLTTSVGKMRENVGKKMKMS